ncbi:MAG: DUF2336 domain-containing protein [Brevundimonas sp.]|uniref:DUF2336 domain-containing protein n=1 Tax=Brevundimonas sp. TaxID=1871086 RepID=UPI004033D475
MTSAQALRTAPPAEPPAASRLPELIALAQEPSSESRRALLRELTESFFGAATRSPSEMALYDEVLSGLAREMEAGVRAELAQRFADAADAPVGLVRRLAADEPDVAVPVLTRSPVLTETDLLAIARSQGQAHLRAVSGRSDVTEALSDLIVQRGDDETLGVLLRNDDARLSQATARTAVERAKVNPALHEAAVQRRNLPPELLNEMYFVVETRLRQQIVAQNALLGPEVIEAALEATHNRVAVEDGVLPPDHAGAAAQVDAIMAKGPISPQTLVRLLRQPSRTAFLIALSRLADIDFGLAAQIVARQEVDALAVLAKAADLDRPLFMTLVVVILGDGGPNAMGRAQEYGHLYGDLTRDQALRTVRFWRMRRGVQAA